MSRILHAAAGRGPASLRRILVNVRGLITDGASSALMSGRDKRKVTRSLFIAHSSGF